MQKYILVKLLEDVPVGSEFSAATWPLHLTLVDDFLSSLDEVGIQQKLNELLANHLPYAKTMAISDDLLGPLKTVPVVLLQVTPTLLSLHTLLVDFLKQSAVVLVSPEFAGEGYKPHVTIQDTGRVAVGSEVIVDTVSIVAMSPDGKTRLKLIDTIKLSGA